MKENLRKVVFAAIASVGFCLYLVLAATVSHHFEVLAGRTFNAAPLFVSGLLFCLLAAVALRAALAYTRRREFRGALQIDWSAVAASVILVAAGVVFWVNIQWANILFSDIYAIPLFFLLSCCVRRGRGAAVEAAGEANQA